MGVGGSFWDLLKPYARNEGADFLRDKRVAVDLSFWIVQHEAAVRCRSPRARSPHLRTTFFRTVALFAKMGAFPVFVVDGDPSPLKAQARMERFLRGSGLDPSSLPRPLEEEAGGAAPVKQRNQAFTRCVRECVELLELLGMPVLKARSEAEALCAQLNSEGHVDACITADSDAFLFGAKCVIKCLRSNSKEPFECYYMSDIEAGLGLRRKQMVAIALLVGNDHNLHGVPGFGVDTAVRFVQLFSEDEILNRLCEVGKGATPLLHSYMNLLIPSLDKDSTTARSPHCSHCGHPGSKRAHSKFSCEHCIVDGSENCIEKPTGFKCVCSTCDKDRKIKEQRKHENWQIKVCRTIASEQNFPNSEIVEIYLSNNNGSYSENDGPSLRWDKPKVEALVDLLAYHQHWEPSYIRQRMLPMLSTIYLREIASTLTPKEGLLLYEQYEFHSIQRVKIRFGHPYYLVKWKRAANSTDSAIYSVSNEHSEMEESESAGVSDSTDLLDEPDVPLIRIDDGGWFLLTDENIELVQAAFPQAVDIFLEEKRLKESSSKQRRSSSRSGKNKVKNDDKLETPKSAGVQLSITEFYRSTKVLAQAKPLCEGPEKNPCRVTLLRKMKSDSDQNLPKSVRRRLLFD